MSSQTPATKRYGRRSSVIALESGKVFFSTNIFRMYIINSCHGLHYS